jgi:hypothetical protein
MDFTLLSVQGLDHGKLDNIKTFLDTNKQTDKGCAIMVYFTTVTESQENTQLSAF